MAVAVGGVAAVAVAPLLLSGGERPRVVVSGAVVAWAAVVAVVAALTLLLLRLVLLVCLRSPI